MPLGTELVFALALLLHPAWVAEKLWERLGFLAIILSQLSQLEV